jgi:hypothetical protein
LHNDSDEYQANFRGENQTTAYGLGVGGGGEEPAWGLSLWT